MKLSKEDERVVDAAIQKVGKGPKEQPRTRGSRSRSLRNMIIERAERSSPIATIPVNPDLYVQPVEISYEHGFTYSPTIVVPVSPSLPAYADITFDTAPNVVHRTINTEQYEVEVRMINRLHEWFPYFATSGIGALSQSLYEAGVRNIMPPPGDYNGSSNSSICISRFDHYATDSSGLHIAIEIPMSNMIRWFDLAYNGAPLNIDWSSYATHPCSIPE